MEGLNDRFKDLPWSDFQQPVLIGGVGGIGSWVVLLLSRFTKSFMEIYDMDTIETHNIGGQFYKQNEVGMSKTESIVNSISEYSSYDRAYAFTEFGQGSGIQDICISAFDNMSARKLMIKKWFSNVSEKKKEGKIYSKNVYAFIDGRMTAEQGIVYVVNSKSRYDRYMSLLKTDDEIEELPCSVRATSHNGARIASEIIAVLTNMIFNKKVGMSVREVPFKITYEFASMTYNTTN